MNIIDKNPAVIAEIATQHFRPSLLTGTGKLLAQNEIMAHIEIMEECGDICWAGENKDIAQHTGSNKCLSIIGAYLH